MWNESEIYIILHLCFHEKDRHIFTLVVIHPYDAVIPLYYNGESVTAIVFAAITW